MFSSPLILTSLIAFIVIAVLNGFQFKIPYSEFRPQFLCDKRIVNWAFIIKKGNLATNITWYPLFSRLLKKETKTASCRQTFKRFCYHHVFHLHLKKALTYVTSILQINRLDSYLNYYDLSFTKAHNVCPILWSNIDPSHAYVLAKAKISWVNNIT